MLHLTERLLQVEDEFLAALGDGEGAMCAFEWRWEKLLEDVDVAASSPAGLDCNTASLVHTIALRVAVLAEASTTIVTDYETITSQLMDDIDSLMSELTLSDFPLPHFADTVTPLVLDGSYTMSGPAEPTQPCRKRRHDSAKGSLKGIKRSRLASDTVDQGHEQPGSSVHRIRCKSPLIPVSTSPGPTLDNGRPSMDHASVPLEAKQPSRKRCLSDADLLVPPRPKRLQLRPRLHAVSDSFLPSSTPAPLFLSKSSCTVDLQHVPLTGILDIQPLIGSVDMDPSMQVPPTVFPGLEETDDSQPISPDLDELLRTWLYHSSSIFPAPMPIGANASCVHDPSDVNSPSTPIHMRPVSPRSPSSTASTPPPSTPPSLYTALGSSPPIYQLDPLLFSDLPSSYASLMDSSLSFQPGVGPFWCGTPQTLEHSVVLPSAKPVWCSEPFPCGAPDTSGLLSETLNSISMNGYVELGREELACAERFPEAVHERNIALVI